MVIAATAIAAIIQLRHLRAGNQLQTLLTIMHMWNSSEMQQNILYCRQVLPERLADPEFLALFAKPGLNRAEHRELLVADFFEQLGSYVKYGLLNDVVWLDAAAPQMVVLWQSLAPAINKMRESVGDSAYENFEVLAVRSQLWLDRHPDGNYPKGLPRMRTLMENRQ